MRQLKTLGMVAAALATWLLAAVAVLQLRTAQGPSVPHTTSAPVERALQTAVGRALLKTALAPAERADNAQPPFAWLASDDLDAAAVADVDALRLATPPGEAAADPAPTRMFSIKFGHTVTALRVEEVCGLESALRAYPTAEVVLLTTASFNTSSLAVLEPAYGRRVRLLDVATFAALLERVGTLPELAAWFSSGAWRPGYPLNNLSNGFRMALVYLLGGIYFDLDILHMRAMPTAHTNVLVYQDNGSKMNNAVIRFERHHPFLRAAVAAFVNNFNGTAWASNGPVRFTQTYKDECGGGIRVGGGANPLARPYCATLTVLKRISYYPIHFGNVKDLYQPSAEVDQLLAGDMVLGVHIWNAMSRKNITHVDPQSPFYKLAQRGCPDTLARHGPAAFLERDVRQQRAPIELSSSA